MKIVDARDRDCPAPVLMAREAVETETPQTFCVIVNNDAARQNVCRFLKSMGYAVSEETRNEDVHITGVRSESAQDEKEASPAQITQPSGEEPGQRRIMVMITTDRMGYGDDTLGQKLMINYIRTAGEFGTDLWQLVFVNNGVKLAIDTSEVVDTLQQYEAQGVTILVCGTCLEHYALTARKRVGETTNMLDIVTAMHLADKVIVL